MESYIPQHRPIPEDIYSTMYFDGYHQQFPEKITLLKFALLILRSMVNVEQGFSTMNLLISQLCTSLDNKNLNRFMRVCLNRPEKLSDETVEKLINTFITTRHRIISLRSFITKRKSYFVFFI